MNKGRRMRIFQGERWWHFDLSIMIKIYRGAWYLFRGKLDKTWGGFDWFASNVSGNKEMYAVYSDFWVSGLLK